uniref:homeobox protein NANOG n=1 Tax=Doryrhamphus excisus TaxID=161450 RepID=UPI0025AE7259|nr:homeobox protein NANOG [Doryrhamphus excisus]
MADWKTQISYNYNPSYHAYAYGLVYQHGHEQHHAGNADYSNYAPGVAQVYYAATARSREESPPHSPEQHVANGHCHYQSPGAVYLGESQANRRLLLQPGSHRAAYDATAEESKRAGSDSTSDSEAYASPDSWSYGSNREGTLPQTADPTTLPKKDPSGDADRSPGVGDVSSSFMGEPPSYTEVGNVFPLQMPLPTPKKETTTPATETPKGKVRVAFSESQMNALVKRFSVQRYLPPAEMKNLAEHTGLTYKQVKTWFQNRRMKLRRHQKDDNWRLERYCTNTDRSPGHGAFFGYVPPYQPETQRPAFKKTTPQNMSFYLASMGSATGSAGYPSGTPGQAMVPAAGWPMPSGVGQYEYNPGMFHLSGNNEPDSNFEGKDGEPVTS